MCMVMRKYIDIIRDANWKCLQSDMVHANEHEQMCVEGGAMAQAKVIGDDDMNDTNEWIIKVASQRYIQEGKSVSEARQIVLSAFSSMEGRQISIDDL